MRNAVCQRWRGGRASYRPAGELIEPREYEVAPLGEAAAKAFVVAHHYSKSYPAARFRFGLWRRGALVGAAVFSHPCRDEVLTSVFPGPALDAVELGRFVLLDDVPGNGETWFLARALAALRREGLRGVVSFSDPFPRETASGEVVFAGHLGVIYQASNAVYLGRGQRRTLRLLPDGRVLSARAISKIRAGERGWRHAAAVLESFGAEPLRGDPAAWLAAWLPRLTRAVRHTGYLRYAFPLWRPARRALPASLPYPKRLDVA
jgi:hypothetical protein